MATYCAAIFKEDGGYYAEFPDLDGCFTQAETLEMLDAMLKDALFVWLDASREDGDDIPEPSGFQAIHEAVSGRDDFHSVTLVVSPETVKRIRKNVSFTEHDLAIIDQAAAQRRMDRSEYLAMAAKRVASGACDV
jgi:predicted RNase H-like HicB family nuclease